MGRPLVIFVDVDDTFVRSASHSRVPMPDVIEAVRRLHSEGAEPYRWSSGGGDYARESAEEFGLAECFTAFLPKPNVMIDDVPVASWHRLKTIHPNEVSDLNVVSLRSE